MTATVPSTRPLGLFPGSSEPRLYDTLIAALRTRHYSRRTEQAYAHWIRRFILFHNRRHPRELSETDVNAFLTHLAVKEHVAASTQNQALSALLFLYDKVLEQPLDSIEGVVRARRSRHLPTVLTREEVRQLLDCLRGTERLVATLLYGSGLRLLEGLRLRVKDVDFERQEITVRDGKGRKDRLTMLSASLAPQLRQHLARVREIHKADLDRGFGRVEMPFALARKYPQADAEWSWQYLFPATKISADPRSGVRRRHHLHESAVARALKRATRQAGLTKRVSSHTLRHSFATHLIEDGYDIRTVQELLGHKDVKTTMIDTHVLNRGGRAVTSPADNLEKLGDPG